MVSTVFMIIVSEAARRGPVASPYRREKAFISRVGEWRDRDLFKKAGCPPEVAAPILYDLSQS